MVGLQTLDLAIGVRVPASQPKVWKPKSIHRLHRLHRLSELRVWNFVLRSLFFVQSNFVFRKRTKGQVPTSKLS